MKMQSQHSTTTLPANNSSAASFQEKVKARVRDREKTVPGIIQQIGEKWEEDNAKLLTLFNAKHSAMSLWLRLANKGVKWCQMQQSVNRSMLNRLTTTGPGLSKVEFPVPTDVKLRWGIEILRDGNRNRPP